MEECCPPDNSMLNDFLEKYFNQDQIAEDFCCEEGCGSRGNFPKKLTLITRESSNFIVVILLRANYEWYDARTKTTTKVNSYDNKIDITQNFNIIDNEGEVICYEPISVIPHLGVSGRNSAGHYICNIKQINGDWLYCADDQKQTVIKPANVTKKGYVILYKRKK